MRSRPATRVSRYDILLGRIAERKSLVLRIDPKDRDALQTKLFLLLQTEQYTQALTLISDVNKQNEQDKGAFLFEKAYTLHRLHQEEDATEVLQALKDRGDEEENRGVAHLEAQLVCALHLHICISRIESCVLQAYREGDYQIAYDLYNTLLDTAEPVGRGHPQLCTLHAHARYPLAL